jgi:outer membrane protein assembly factor BamB
VTGRRAVVDAGSIVLVLVILAGAGFLYAEPWRTAPRVGGAELDRYLPDGDGTSFLAEVRDGDGKLLRYEGTNVSRIPLAQVFLTLPGTVTSTVTMAASATADDALDLDADRASKLASTESLAPLERAEISTYDILALDAASGAGQTAARASQSVDVRAPSGFYQAGLVTNDGTILAISPPLLLLPAGASEDSKPWKASGSAGNLAYGFDGKITAHGSHTTPLGTFDDCLTAETRLVLGEGDTAQTTTSVEHYCAGPGLVDRVDTTKAQGRPDAIEVTNLVSTTNLTGVAASRPEIAAAPDQPASKDIGSPDGWAVTRVGRTARTGVSVGASALPTFVPSEPQQLLSVDEAGNVVSFDTTTGLEAWRFHAASAVYGRPSYDPSSGTILFGSADRRVYALDSRGTFKWSFDTGDNIASEAVVVDGTVVLGSEDRNVYGLDVETGAQRWVVNDSAAIASSPAAAKGVVAIGDDDGNLLGIDPRDGSTRWSTDLPGSAEGAVTTDGTTFFIGSSGDELAFGSVTAVDAATGDTVWTSRIPNSSRVAVALGDSLVFSVDTSGVLDALDKSTGAPHYETHSLYAGAAVALGDTAVALRFDGTIDVLDEQGSVTDTFSAKDALSKADEAPDFTLGLSEGGGAIWMADANAVVYRLGPGDPAINPLTLRFLDPNTSTAGLDHGPTTITPVGHDGDAVVVDGLGGISVVDPSDGSSRAVGEFDTTTSIPRTDPVVSGDLVIAAVGGDLQAIDLKTGKRAWTVEGEGFPFAAPVVTEDGIVLWADALAATTTGELRAVDASNGDVLWTAPLKDVTGVAPALAGDVVIAGSPPTAFDVRTGSVVWTAALTGSPVGPAAFDGRSRTVIATMAEDDGSHVVGLDASSGAVRWDTPLPDASFDPAQAVAVEGSVAVVSTASPGPLLGVDVRTGTVAWTFQPPSSRFGMTATADGIVYAVLSRGAVLAIDASSGEQVGRFIDLDVPLRSFDRSVPRPASIDGTIVVALGSFLAGLEPPGGG